MEMFRAHVLKELVKPRDEHCFSIYIPTHKEWDKMSQDKIRFKNKLQDIKAKLKEKGFDEVTAKSFLQQPESYLSVNDFWQHQSNGLAMFFTKNELFYYRLSIEFDERVEISDRYYIKPLLPLLTGDGRYFVLALNLEETKFYLGSRFTTSEVNLPVHTPINLAQAVQYDDPEKSFQFHVGDARAGAHAAVYHGQGVGKDKSGKKKQIRRFFEKLNKGVMEKLHEERVPLVLVGVEYLLPMYREANSYPHLMDKGVDKDPQYMSVDEISSRTWDIVEPVFKKKEQEALSRYADLSNTSNTLTEFKGLIRASLHSQIDTLFLDPNMEKWGTYDEEKDELVIDDGSTGENKELVEYVAVNTINNGGTVYSIDGNVMPNGENIAALLRFS